MVPPVSMSVIVTAHQRPTYLRAAVESALHQSLPRSEYEVLVTKDFTDPDLDRFLDAAGVRVVPYREAELGPMYVRAASEAKGDVLLFLDDDDLFEPTKLAQTDRIFRNSPDLSYFHHWYHPIDQAGRPLDPSLHRDRERRHRLQVGSLWLPGAEAVARLQPLPELAADFCGSCTVVRRDLISDRRSYCGDPEMNAPDTFLFFSALLSGGSLAIDPMPLTRYRLHLANRSRPRSPEERALWHERLDRSYRLILRMAEAEGPPELVREAEALLLLHRIDRALEDPRVSRSEIRALYREGRRLIGTHRWNARTRAFGHRGLLVLLSLYAISPRLAGATRNRWRNAGSGPAL